MKTTAILIGTMQVALATVFAWTALAKVKTWPAAVRAATDLGASARWSREIATSVILLEVGLAIGLLWPAAVVLSAWAATAMLTCFSLALARVLLRGDQVACQCFGPLSRGAVGKSAIVRNAFLTAMAVSIAVAGPTNVVRADSTAPSEEAIAAAVAIALFTVAICVNLYSSMRLTRKLDDLQLRLESLEIRSSPIASSSRSRNSSGLAVGDPVPPFSLQSCDDREVTLRSLLRGRDEVVLIFTRSRCMHCATLLPEIAKWQSEKASMPLVVLVSEGPALGIHQSAVTHRLINVLMDPYGAVARSFHSVGVPSAVTVNRELRVVSPMVTGEDAIRSLVESLHERAHPPT